MILIDEETGLYFNVTEYIIAISFEDRVDAHGRRIVVKLIFKSPNLVDATMDIGIYPAFDKDKKNILTKYLIKQIGVDDEYIEIKTLRSIANRIIYNEDKQGYS